MCPCVLIDKLRRAIGIGKKSNRSNNTPSEQASQSAEINHTEESTASKSKETSKETSKEPIKKSSESKEKSKKEKKKKKKTKKKDTTGDSSTTSIASVTSNQSVPSLKVNVQELLGQVVTKKSNPKNFMKRVLEVERPDLFGDDGKLTDLEIQFLDTYLLMKGDMRIGINIRLGRVIDCDNDKSVVGDGDLVTVVTLYAHGRFGSIHLVHRDTSVKEPDVIGRGLALKTSRRLMATSRMENEIKILRRLCREEKVKELKDVPRITHVTPMFFHGVSGGSPYLMMPMMDANLMKVRQEIGYTLPWADAFYIAQEVMIGMRQCHEHLVVHCDIKPTNVLLHRDQRNWWLCDFGEACLIGESRQFSPPDALTLPFVSRSGHKAIGKSTPASIEMDIESWFYLLLELFTTLPWSTIVEEDATLEAKNSFWSSLSTFFQKNEAQVPSQVQQIAQIVAEPSNPKPHASIQAILKDGFSKHNVNPPWKSFWQEKRPVKVAQTPVDNAKVKGKLVPMTPKALPKGSSAESGKTGTSTASTDKTK